MNLQDALAAVRAAGYTISKSKPKAKPQKGSAALEFHAEFQLAKEAATLELGENWRMVPGSSQWINVPARLANYRFTRPDGSQSALIRNPRDYRAPAPRFWKDGKLPIDVIAATTSAPDPARARMMETHAAWLDYRAHVAKALLVRGRTLSPDERRDRLQTAWDARRRFMRLNKAV